MHQLALHQITMMDGGPEGLVRFAAESGLDGVCLFTATPLDANGRDMFPVVEPAGAPSFKRLLRDHDMRIINAEYFPVMPDRDVAEYLPAISLAAELGAKRLVTHIHESDSQRINWRACARWLRNTDWTSAWSSPVLPPAATAWRARLPCIAG